MFEDLREQLSKVVQANVDEAGRHWLKGKIAKILGTKSSKDLYISYSLCTAKISNGPLQDVSGIQPLLRDYLSIHEANCLEISRIFLLFEVLLSDKGFDSAVRNLIQIADKEELATFLKYLTLLPEPENYKFAAVEALRSNIATVFDAISSHNPYPARYFNDQQWNQMYLKAAFMQRDLGKIVDVDKRANRELARIISDYAHERWAASRDVDPIFWRPVSNFIDQAIEKDLKRLFDSENQMENEVAALVCHNSELDSAKMLLNQYPTLKTQVEEGTIFWKI